MCLADVDDEELDAIPVAAVELVQRAQLAAKRRSGVRAEDERDGATTEIREADVPAGGLEHACARVELGELEVGGDIACGDLRGAEIAVEGGSSGGAPVERRVGGRERGAALEARCIRHRSLDCNNEGAARVGTVAMIEAEGLVKIYRSRRGQEVRALDGVDLEVEEGTVVGLLGPNGAGKTTTVRILATLLRADGGTARVGGLDVRRDAQALRRLVGLSGQYAAVDENLTGRENLWMFGRLYHLGSAEARRRADELLGHFALADAADRVAKTYSGGMRRRLDLASALIGRPRLLFLDEPTTGLDPRSRLAMWEVIRQQVQQGVTVLLTTQYLEEADELADDIAVVDTGKIIARGTSDALKAQVGGERIEVVIHRRDDLESAAALLAPGGRATVDRDERRVTFAAERGAQQLVEVVQRLGESSIVIDDIGLRRPTLDDVFLELTGHAAEELAAGEHAGGKAV